MGGEDFTPDIHLFIMPCLLISGEEPFCFPEWVFKPAAQHGHPPPLTSTSGIAGDFVHVLYVITHFNFYWNHFIRPPRCHISSRGAFSVKEPTFRNPYSGDTVSPTLARLAVVAVGVQVCHHGPLGQGQEQRSDCRSQR